MSFVTPAAHKTVTADGAVKAASGELVGVLLTGVGAAATIILYDNASAASGTVLCTLKAASDGSATFTPALPYVFTNGCYADITGTNATATVVYI